MTLASVSAIQLVGLWSDLEQAWHGTNSYGGDTAEVYIYRLMARSPMVEAAVNRADSVHNSLITEWANEAFAEANLALYELLRFFADRRDCAITLDGQPLGEWVKTADLRHRVHITVTPNKSK